MIAFVRLAALLFVVLSVVYVCVWFYLRAVRKDRLEEEWAANPQGDRDAFVHAGLQAQNPTIKRVLILVVYVLPITALAAFIYITNMS